MLEKTNFLCEIGTQEIPAGYLPPAIESIKKIVKSALDDNRVDHEAVEVFATPRRIAIMISRLAESQRSETVEVKGPAVKSAFDPQGNPTKAMDGFLKGQGASLNDVVKKSTDKGEYVYLVKKLASGKTVDIIPDIIRKVVEETPFPKRMRWSDKKITFPRPIDYFLLMFNDAVVPFEIDGVKASNKTRGHYIQHNKMIDIKKIASYEEMLDRNGVIVDQARRKGLIRSELAMAAEKAGGRLMEDEGLLDTVTYLVEQPYVVACEFNKDFLVIPDIVLIAEMKEHQKYFAVNDAQGKLMNKFLVVSNNPGTDHVKAGNARVVTARFNDARFFYDEDRKVRLADRIGDLKKVLFHKELGSIYQKVERMNVIAAYIADTLKFDKALREKINRAVTLCKTDLETAMVFEFGSLQGAIGRLYALHDGEDPEVADAIEQHYRPKFSGDVLPAGKVAMVVSLSEKIDNIFGSFSVGNIPKGSADPYALRRQANAIVEIIIQNDIRLDLKDLLEHVAGNYRDGAILVPKIIEFVSARAKTIMMDRGIVYDEIDACLTIGSADYLELYRRAASIHEFRKNEKFSEMLLGFKRMNNIVTAFLRENKDHALAYDPKLAIESAEKELYAFFDERKKEIAGFIAGSKYIELFELLIKGKGVIDAFFDKVLVMDKNTAVRDNRLYKLKQILDNFKALMDFSKISDKE